MKILLVDNDRVFLNLIERFLLSEGHEVLSAADGLSALDITRDYIPDFIFIDHVMPNIDGKTLCGILRSDPKFNSSFIVILSAVAAEEWNIFENIKADACIAKTPIENMKNHLREVIMNPESTRQYFSSGNVIGIDEIYPRTITRELFSSKKHLISLLDNISEGVIELNSDYRIVYINPYANKLFNKNNKNIFGLDIQSFLGVEKVNIDRLFQNETSVKSELFGLIYCSDIDKYLRLESISTDNDETHHFIIINDLTDIKNNENKLIETNSFLRSILDSSCSISVISTDLEQNILFWNKGAERLFGYSPEEVVDKEKITILYPSSMEIELANRIRNSAISKDESASFEMKELTKEGKEIWVKVHVSPRKNETGEICGVLGIGEDITKSKKLSEELKKSEERYRLVLEGNPDPVIVYDVKGRVVYFNRSFTRVFGWVLDDRVGKKMDHFVPDQNWPETHQMIEKVKRGESFSGTETKRYTKNGDLIDVSISASTYTDDRGNLLGSVINLRDITQQKKLEQQLLFAQKMESIGTLAGGIAHDFNNLLMGILGRISIISSDSEASQAYSEHFAAIESYIRSATSLTKQLLGVSRGGKYEVKPVDINELLLSSSSMFGRTRKEIRIFTDFHKPAPIVSADRSQLEQVLLNLFVNAWQAMPGGGDIFLETTIVDLNESDTKAYGCAPGRYARISISDTGVGIDKDSIKRIFDPFFTTKERGRGTGLGLASAYGIIKNHGGIIAVSSDVGHGSTFNIYLPISAGEPKSQKDLHSRRIVKGSETVLLVDDEEMIVEVGKAMLEKLGYSVIVASSGEQAIEIVKGHGKKIGLIILDVVMPGMKGDEAFGLIRKIHPSIPVLLSSGYALNGQAEELIKQGCNGFIAKPFNMSDLSRSIRRILDI